MDPNQNQPNNTSPQENSNPLSSAAPPSTPAIPSIPPIEDAHQMPGSSSINTPTNPVIPIISVEDEHTEPTTPATEPVVTPLSSEAQTQPSPEPEDNQSEQPTTSPSMFDTNDAPKKSKKKFYAAIAGVVLLLVSIPLAIFLVQQNQEIRNKAAGSDPLHCASSDGKRLGPNSVVEANCSGWDQSNNSCSSDSVNTYYFSSCAPTGAAVASHPDGCARATDTVQCLDDTQKKEARNLGFNAVCYSNGNPAESIKVSENRCGAVIPTGKHPDGCTRLTDTVQCLDDTQKKEARNIGFNAVCYNGTAPAESILVSEGRCGKANAAGGPASTATVTSADVQPRNVTKGQPLTFTAASTGVGTIHVRIWPNDAPGVTAVDGGKIPGGNGSISYDTNKLPAGTNTAKIRFQAQDASGKDIEGVAKDIDITVASGTSAIQVTNATVTPSSPTLGQTVTFGAQLTGGTGMIHVRIWPNDAPGVTAVDGGKIGVGQTSVTYDTSKLPANTKTALVRFQAQDASGKDIGGVAKDITVTFLQAVAGDSRCTQIEMIKGGTIIYTSDAGNVAPQIKPGDQLTFKVYCFTADASDDYDYFRISVTKPDGTTLTQDPVAQRETKRDQGSNRFFSASYNLTADSTGAYTIKSWGHMKKAAWKGAN
jgi:hypothetical protein